MTVHIARTSEPSVGFGVMNLFFLPFVFNLWGPYHRYMGLHMFIALKHVLATFISRYCPSYVVCSKGESINWAVDKKGGRGRGQVHECILAILAAQPGPNSHFSGLHIFKNFDL